MARRHQVVPRLHIAAHNACAVTKMGYHCYTNQGGVVRRYRTKQERVSWLQAYHDELENELTAVKERIAQVEAE